MTTQRRMRTVLCGLVLIGWTMAGARTAYGDSFEGTVRQISLSMPTAGLRPGADKLEPAQIFAISDEKLAELANAPGSAARIASTDIKIDGPKFRVDMVINGKDGYMLVDSAANTTSLVLPGDKMYLQITQADQEAEAKKRAAEATAKDMLRKQSEKLKPEDKARLQAALGPAGVPTAAAGTPEMKPTGTQGVVNNFHAAEFELRDGQSVSRGWVTQEHPELLAALRASMKSQQSLRSIPPTPMERFAELGLPVRVQTVNGDRYEQIELVEIKPEKLPDDLFQIPSDFTRVDPKATPAAVAAATPAPTPAAAPKSAAP